MYWKNGVNDILKKVLNGKRTIQEARFYMEKHYVGQTREAIVHQAFETTGGDITNEATVYNLIKDAIKLGYGKDTSLDRCFR